MLADEMVIANVQLVQGLPERSDHARVAVAQVENAAVAVAVNELAVPCHVPDVDTFAFAKDKVNTDLRKELGLAARYVARKALDDFGFRVLTDE
jgi:hypothetical protein